LIQEIEFFVKSPGEATLRERRVVTLFSDKSPYDMLVLHYSPSNKLGKIKGRVFDAGGNLVREIEKKEIRDESAISDFSIYEDDRVRYVDVDFTSYPYTVEFEYEMTYTDLLGYPDWTVQRFHTAVERSSFSLNLTEKMQVHYKALNTNILPSEKTADGRHTITWSAAELPAVRWEPFCPAAVEVLPKILVSPHEFEMENYTGSMASWKSFGEFMNVLMKNRDELSPAMEAKVRELTAGAATDKEKIDALYRFMQQNIRYVSVQLGIGGWQPFDAKYVEENKYGDCKALSNFMKAMLKEVGIESFPVLIQAGEEPFEVTEDFATNAFNHMILHVPSQDYWLECTSENDPPNYLGAFTANRNVVLLTPSGGKIARTPDLPPAANLESNEIAIALQAGGEAVVEVKSDLTGASQEWLRSASKHYSKEEFQKEFQEASALPTFLLENLSAQADPDAPKATLNYTAKITRFASKAGKRLFVPLNAVHPFSKVPPSNDKRLHPVVVREGYVETDKVVFALPQGYEVESVPSGNLALETEFGSYSLKVVKEEGTLSVERRLEIKPVRLPAEKYNAWRDFYKEVARADGGKLVLVEKKS
ncbi:MAG: DUF3857 domain-containing protein, partial [Bacteroidetes bacterium]|nr:DUF3857 domain-containing protein [Bacteroidota bacterium]